MAETLVEIEKGIAEAHKIIQEIRKAKFDPRWKVRLLNGAQMTLLVVVSALRRWYDDHSYSSSSAIRQRVLCLPTFPVFSAGLTAVDTFLVPPLRWCIELNAKHAATALDRWESVKVTAMQSRIENMSKMRHAVRERRAPLLAIEVHRYGFDADKLVEDIVKARRGADASFRLCETEKMGNPGEAFCVLVETVKNIVQRLASNGEPDETDVLNDELAVLEDFDVKEVGNRVSDIL